MKKATCLALSLFICIGTLAPTLAGELRSIESAQSFKALQLKCDATPVFLLFLVLSVERGRLEGEQPLSLSNDFREKSAHEKKAQSIASPERSTPLAKLR